MNGYKGALLAVLLGVMAILSFILIVRPEGRIIKQAEKPAAAQEWKAEIYKSAEETQ